MAGSTYGTLFRITTWGESHGPAIGVVIDGCPSGLSLNEEDIQNVVDEMIDRFGNMPNEIENLLDIARIKTLCKKLKISKVQEKRNFVVFIFEAGEIHIDINELLKKYRNRILQI